MARRLQQQRRKIDWTALTAIGALIFTALSLNATRDQIAITQQGQYTDRYSRAIEQLGRQEPEQVQIRLGGIYALERLAHDSPRDQPTIMAVLATFVRTSAPQIPEVGCPETPVVDIPYPQGPPPDVQAALTVIGRRDTSHDDYPDIDLRSTCLTGADLDSTNLTNVDLSYADLSYADLGDADLTGANFTNVDLSYADLGWANLTEAEFAGVSFNNADIGGANLTGTNLHGADLTGVEHSATHFEWVLTDEHTKGQWW